MARVRIRLLLGCACIALAACEPVAIAMLGAGASTALRYNLDGVASRTFTASASAVKSASLAALEHMGLEIDAMQALEQAELIVARAPNRRIEIELEPITKVATRVRITARSSALLYDTATAAELVQQTEKMLTVALEAKRLGPRLTSN